jgi:cell division protein FtsQ
MKCPDGFDPKPNEPEPRRARQSRVTSAAPAVRTTPPVPAASSSPPESSSLAAAAARPERAPRPPRALSTRAARPDAATRAQLRRVARDRKRFEKAEVRRFTRRARNRKIGFAVLAALLATVIGLILGAVYSPILALRTITVDGTSRIGAAEVNSAVDGQIGTPLALLDYDAITEDLSVFPLIRSYVTEIVPPDTLRIHITERAPVGSVRIGDMYNLVDPAGIVVQQSAERIAGVPLLVVPGGDLAGPAFSSMVAVLLALPPETLAQVDSVSASTKDDVALVLTGVGQGVTWGSADDSERKARLLLALIGQTDPNQPGVFDVSAPSNGIFRPS